MPRHEDNEGELRKTAAQLDENCRVTIFLQDKFRRLLHQGRLETRRNFCGVLGEIGAALEEHHILRIRGGESYENAVKRSLKIEHTPH